jgi:hypothetical protein
MPENNEAVIVICCGKPLEYKLADPKTPQLILPITLTIGRLDLLLLYFTFSFVTTLADYTTLANNKNVFCKFLADT